MTQLLYKRLIARGHKSITILPIFTNAAQRIKTKPLQKNTPNRIFHISYHPQDVSRKFIRNAYETICEIPDENEESFKKIEINASGEKLSIEKLTVSYSRLKNLRDILIPSTLYETKKCSVQKIIENMK